MSTSPSYKVRFLRELSKGGSISCSRCGKRINFIESYTIEQVKQYEGVEWDCIHCGEFACSIGEEEIVDLAEQVDIDEEIYHIRKLIGPVMTDDDVEEVQERLAELRKEWQLRR